MTIITSQDGVRIETATDAERDALEMCLRGLLALQGVQVNVEAVNTCGNRASCATTGLDRTSSTHRTRIRACPGDARDDLVQDRRIHKQTPQ